MHIAVIGGGLAGLSAAWLLGRVHQVTLFERQSRPGFTAASVAVPGPAGQAVRVDVPLRVFYPGYYPTLTRLYQALGVATEPVSYAATLTDARGALLFRYRNLRWGQRSVAWVAPHDLLGAPAWQVVGGWLQFQRQARSALAQGALQGLSVGAWLAQQRYPAAFVEQFLLPAIATVCTCSLAQVRGFPATVIVDYLSRGLDRQAVRRALHGADDVQRRLLAGIHTLHADARIQRVQRRDGGMVLSMSDGVRLRFDAVVLATQANQALALLGGHEDSAHGGATADEAAMLAGFHYTPVQVLTHTDPALMPPRRRHWSPVNLWLNPAHDAPESTIWVNAVQPALRGAPPVFQTVNPLRPPGSAALIGQARFERPIVDARSQAALVQLQRLHEQPDRRLWFCGSYAQAGVPLLESAVRSALAVAQRLGAGWADDAAQAPVRRAENSA